MAALPACDDQHTGRGYSFFFLLLVSVGVLQARWAVGLGPSGDWISLGFFSRAGVRAGGVGGSLEFVCVGLAWNHRIPFFHFFSCFGLSILAAGLVVSRLTRTWFALGLVGLGRVGFHGGKYGERASVFDDVYCNGSQR